MSVIKTDIFGAAVAFLIGVLLAVLNFFLAKKVLMKNPSMYSISQVAKQIIQIGFLVVIFAFGDYTPWDKTWLLLGGALGITLPAFWFTYRLVKFNDSLKEKEDRKDG